MLLSQQDGTSSSFLFNLRSQDRTLECSICQLVVPVPAKGIEAFPLNFFINNMLTVLAVQNPTKCTNCEDSSQATARCLDCVENLCTNCVFAHKRIRQTKDHRILSFDEIQANEVKDIIRCPSFCSVHPREVRNFLDDRALRIFHKIEKFIRSKKKDDKCGTGRVIGKLNSLCHQYVTNIILII